MLHDAWRGSAFKTSVKKAILDPVILHAVRGNSSALAACGGLAITSRPPRCVGRARMKTAMGMSMKGVVDVWKGKSASAAPTVVKVVSVALGVSSEDAPRHDQDNLSFVVIRQSP